MHCHEFKSSVAFFFPRTYLHIHDILKINMKLINLSKAISLPKFVLLIMERKEKKKKEKEKRSHL